MNPNLSPSGNFDLTHWKLQMPVDANGTNLGNSAEISVAQLSAGFTNAYFYTATDGAMAFWVPDDGATTPGSTHPRSELREMLNPTDANVNWSVYGSHVLSVQCKVTQVPADTGKICIGQIHEPSTKLDGSASANNEQMIMFDLLNQKIYANINLDGNLASSFSQTFISGSAVALNSNISYTISVSNGVLKISVNSVTNAWNLLSGTNYLGHIAQNWDRASSNTMYFKAGDYSQTTDTCGCWTDGAKVSIYSLTAYHAPSITNQPASQTGILGSNVTLAVGAVTHGKAAYQWKLNGTNVSGATNSLLTLTNFSSANVGSYSVAVSDNTLGFSSVTSSVAVLSPPLKFSGVTLATNHLVLWFTGTVGSNYLVQAKTNLTDATWQTIATNGVDGAGNSVFVESNYSRFTRRFYRLSTP